MNEPANPDHISGPPVVPSDVIEETVPGSIRKAEHFIGFLRRLVEYLRSRLKGQQVLQESPPYFLQNMLSALMVDSKPLRFCSERLKSLLFALEIVDTAEYAPLVVISDFTTLIGTYGHLSSYKGGRSFGIVFEPYDERLPQIPDPVLQLACLDASLAMRPIFDRFQSVILTSGTLSPLELYARILGFRPVISKSFTMSLNRRCICPMIVARGPDQVEMSSRHERRSDKSVIRNYGALLIDFAGAVPDGIVVFFTSYVYMEQVIQEWNEMRVVERLLEKKLVFIETPDAMEASLALDNYRRACDNGRGAIFLCVARGKVAEGIDFDRHYGRCVIMMGVPFQYVKSKVLRARLDYMREQLDVREQDYLSFDAMRQAAQCIGRVIRSKSDYGIMVMADRRYVRADKKMKLPPWILESLTDSQVDLDSDMALGLARAFLKQMAQEVPRDSLLGTVLLSEAQVAELSKTGTLPPHPSRVPNLMM